MQADPAIRTAAPIIFNEILKYFDDFNSRKDVDQLAGNLNLVIAECPEILP